MRQPPHSLDSEEYLLSACIVSGMEGVSQAVNAGITPDSFHEPRNAVLFAAIQSLAAKGQPPSPSLILHELNQTRRAEEAGGMAELFRIAKLVPTSAGLSLFITRVRELQLLRAVSRVTASLHEESFSQDANIADFIERAERSILSVTQDRVKPARKWAQAVDEAKVELNAMLEAKPGQALPGEVSWGFADLDSSFGAMQAGQLCVLAARPSVGKSSLMRQTAYSALKAGKGVFIASLEVKDRAIARNMAQAVTGISYRGLRAGANAAEVATFRRELDAIGKLPLHVSDDYSTTVSQICAQARLLKARKGIGLVCIDHLHELGECKNPPKGRNVTHAYGMAVKAFKELAGELELPVLLLAQLNRGSEHEKRTPNLADLRDSGDIEQAADKVVLLHRPTENPFAGGTQDDTSHPRENPSFYVEAIQAKGRDDGTSRVGLTFQRASARFLQIEGAHG